MEKLPHRHGTTDTAERLDPWIILDPLWTVLCARQLALAQYPLAQAQYLWWFQAPLARSDRGSRPVLWTGPMEVEKPNATRHDKARARCDGRGSRHGSVMRPRVFGLMERVLGLMEPRFRTQVRANSSNLDQDTEEIG